MRVWINPPARSCFSLLDPETGVSMHVECVNSVADLFALSLLSAMLLVTIAWKFENGVQLVVGLGFHPSSTKDVDHGVVAGWR